MKKKILFLFLFFGLFLFFPRRVFGAYINDSFDEPCDLCSDYPGKCAKSGGSSPPNCPDCGTPSSGCCSDGLNWTKYDASCRVIQPWPLVCDWVWVYDERICSTGDKCIAEETGLRAGECDCSYGGTYKYCCDASGEPEACEAFPIYDDGTWPDEGKCPGGYLVDGNRVRSEPCPGSEPTPTLPPGVTPTPTSPPPPDPEDRCRLNIDEDVYTVGDIIEVEVWQRSGCDVSYFKYIRNIESQPTWGGPWEQLGPNCEEVGEYDDEATDGQWLSCFWDTGANPPNWSTPYPAGVYPIVAFYPGFDTCDSPRDWCSDTVTLVESRPPEVISVTANPDPALETDTVVFSAVFKDMEKLGSMRTWFGIQRAPYDDQEEASCLAFEDSLVDYLGVMYDTSTGDYEVANQPMLDCPWTNDRFNSPRTAEVTGISSSMVEHDDYYQFNVDYTVEFDNTLSSGAWNLYLMARQLVDGVGIGNCPNHPETAPQCWEIKGSFTISEAIPTCTSATLSPSSLSLEVGEIYGDDGSGLRVIALPGADLDDIDHVDYSGPSFVTLGAPGGEPYFPVTVTADSEGGPDNITATVYLTGGDTCDGSSSVTVTAPGAWFQTEEGDVHADGNIGSEIPDTAADRNFSIGSSLTGGGTWGVVSYDTGTADFGDDGFCSNDSTTHWLADSSYRGSTYDYDYFNNLLPSNRSDFTGQKPNDNGVYQASGDQELNSAWSVGSDESFIILINNGNLTIHNKIEVAEGGFLAFIVGGDTGGNIIIDRQLGINPGSAATRGIEGVFIADGFFRSVPEGEAPLENKQLLGEGIFVADDFDLRRDLGEDNDTYAAEYFEYRPDLLINSPQELWQSSFTWQELAP